MEEGIDSPVMLRVIVRYNMEDDKVKEVELKSRLNWAGDGDILKITEGFNPMLHERLTKEMKVGDEITIQCYIDTDYDGYKSITGISYKP